MSRRLGPAAIGLALVLGAAQAPGDTAPSRWERAKDPRVGDDWDLHVKVSEWLVPGPHERFVERHRRREAAEAWLEEAHAETRPDVRLRFDLGEVYEGLEHHVRAIEVLAPALAKEPDHPAAAAAWLELASAYAHLDRSREEIGAYDAFLARTLSVEEKATVVSNRAEAQMRLGNLDDAIVGYRDAIALARTGRYLLISDVLARWGLAVALDRSGDPTGAAREAGLAAQLDQGQAGRWPAGSIIGNDFGEGVVVFFVPDYEKFYYLGLGMVEHAKQTADPRGAAGLWGKAELLWAQYIAGAEAWNASHKDRSDRWLSLARAHRAKAQKHMGAQTSPPRPPSP